LSRSAFGGTVTARKRRGRCFAGTTKNERQQPKQTASSISRATSLVTGRGFFFADDNFVSEKVGCSFEAVQHGRRNLQPRLGRGVGHAKQPSSSGKRGAVFDAKNQEFFKAHKIILMMKAPKIGRFGPSAKIF